jgi:L-ascorbate 6-phosphate lactonase
MKNIIEYQLAEDKAGLWFIGQSGFIFKACGAIIAIDPYLSDSVARVSPGLTRLYPPPIEPQDLKVDILITTHNHLDHLDPDTITPYQHKKDTLFVAPRLACQKLAKLGIAAENIIKIDSGEVKIVRNIKIFGIYTVPNDPAAIDTAGYKIVFPNEKSIYHCADTDLSDLLLQCAPSADVGLFCINGKWGNMGVEKAATLAQKVNPQYAIPHHYDLMAHNGENPETFRYQLNYYRPDIKVVIPKILEPFMW